jgi:hypothetical protein
MILLFYFLFFIIILFVLNYHNNNNLKNKLINNSFVKPNNELIFEFDEYDNNNKITLGNNVVKDVMFTKNTIPIEFNTKVINNIKDLIYDYNKLNNSYYFIKNIDQIYIQIDNNNNKRYVLGAFIYDINNYYTLKIMVDYVKLNNRILINSIGILEGSYYNILNRYDYTIFSRAYLGEYNTFDKDIINILDENYKKYHKLVGIENTSLDFGVNEAEITEGNQDDLSRYSNIYYPNNIPQVKFDPFCKKHLNLWDKTSAKIKNPNIDKNCVVHNNSTLRINNDPYFAPGVITQRVDYNDYSWMYQPYRANVATRSPENTYV